MTPSRKRGIREWAWSVRTSSEARIVADWPWRERARLYVAVLVSRDGPRRLAQYALTRFRRWSALPGDRWENFQRDRVAVVHSVKRDYAVGEVANRECLTGGWPDGLGPSFERIYHDDPGWIPT